MKSWKVQIRGKSGKTESIYIDADDRSSVFKIARERSLTIISVDEAKGKRPSSADGKPAVGKGLVAGLIVAICGALALWYFLPREAPKHAPVEEKAKKPKSDLPDVKYTAPKVDGPVEAPKKPLHFWEVDASQTNGFNEAQRRKWEFEHRPKPSYTNTTSLTEAKPEYAIFRTPCENEIACYLTLAPGETLVGTPHYTEKQKREYIAALDAPMIYDKDDTEEMRQFRLLMEETKKDLKARIAAGEDIGDILTATREEQQALSMYKNDIKAAFSELSKKPDVTIADIDNFVKAANMMLEEKGIAPMELGVITRRMLQQYHEEQNKK